MKALITAFCMLFAVTACAEQPSPMQYQQTLQPIPTDNPAKIEVTELFWYGCPHCYQLEPKLAVWVKKLPKDVEFKRIPAIPNPSWLPAAKAYYAMEALGLLDKLHSPFFEAIHKQRVIKPNDEAGMADWIARQGGLDRKKVDEVFNSFSLNTKLKRAAQVFGASGATGVPTLVIDGKVWTSSTKAGGNEEALQVADYLIESARAARSAKR